MSVKLPLGRFSIAELFGEEDIRDAYKRAKAEWKKDRIYGTELSMVLNHKCWYWYEEQNEELSKLYAGGKLELNSIALINARIIQILCR